MEAVAMQINEEDLPLEDWPYYKMPGPTSSSSMICGVGPTVITLFVLLCAFQRPSST